MPVDVVDPFGDPRVAHRTALVNGIQYKYLYALPQSGNYRGTVFLIHGWPDCSMGWRYQIPLLLKLSLRVVCPDLMGFGGTSVPRVPPESLALYSQKRASNDIRELARQLGAPKIILGGHETYWGGAVVYRCALWNPDLVTHVFSVCTPYTAPTRSFVPLEKVVERAPQFRYQIHLAGPDVESAIQTDDDIRAFLNGMYGARGPNRETLFSPEDGLLLQNLSVIGRTPLVTDREMDYYVQQYQRNGLHGTLNWYRTREVNWEEERDLPTSRIEIPVLYIQANKDNVSFKPTTWPEVIPVLLPSMSAGMEKLIPNLTRGEVTAGHWALWQSPEDVNDLLKHWVETTVFGTTAGKL